jgi:hypothetical protein
MLFIFLKFPLRYMIAVAVFRYWTVFGVSMWHVGWSGAGVELSILASVVIVCIWTRVVLEVRRDCGPVALAMPALVLLTPWLLVCRRMCPAQNAASVASGMERTLSANRSRWQGLLSDLLPGVPLPGSPPPLGGCMSARERTFGSTCCFILFLSVCFPLPLLRCDSSCSTRNHGRENPRAFHHSH